MPDLYLADISRKSQCFLIRGTSPLTAGVIQFPSDSVGSKSEQVHSR